MITATRPDLLNWSQFLTHGSSLDQAEQTVIDRYVNMDHRFAISPTRESAFKLMNAEGFWPVPYCRVEDAPEHWENVVVYLTERGGHAGRDKVLLSRHDAQAASPHLLCSKFLPGGSVSRRILQVGSFRCEATMRSDDPWRSNCGNVTVEWDIPDHNGNDYLSFGPVWAIDLVGNYAVDFNTSPGLEGVPLPYTAVDLIANWFDVLWERA